jgi:hypothetical protein
MEDHHSYMPDVRTCAEIARKLALEIEDVTREMDRAASRYGLLSQKLVILSEAMMENLKDMNGGVYPTPRSHQRFPELNHLG